MSESSAHKVIRKRDWTLSPRAFRRLLSWLDGGVDSDGLKYLEVRRRLIAYFDRKNCPAPDDLADETFDRVARRLEEEGVTEAEAPARYCYIVARFVFMEHLRGAHKSRASLEEIRRQPPGGAAAAAADDDRQTRERMLNCLVRCTGELEPAEREIITRYYAGEGRSKIENRRALAEELGITANALSIRACRIREKLEGCVRRCVDAE